MAGLTIEGAERLSEINMRELCPEAFALTCNEALRLRRINYTLFMFFDTHREFIEVSREAEGDRPAAYHNIYNDESIALLRSTFKSKRISLSNAAKLAERILNGKWFALDSVVYRDNDDGLPRLYLSTGGERKGVISREDSPEVYGIWDSYTQSGLFDDERMCNPLNAEALREALSLEAGYQYITSYEIDLLRTIKHITEYTSQPFTAPMQAGFITVKATRESQSLVSVGRGALDAAVFDERNRVHNITAATGIEIRIKGKRRDKKALVNVDKLEIQLLGKAAESGFTSPVIELSLDEFMERRHLTDKKEARKQFNKAANDYYETSYEAVSDAGRVRIRPLDGQATLHNSKAQFSFTTRFFDAHKNSGSIVYYPEGLLAIDGKSDNAYTLGRYIWDDIRRNLGKGIREGRLRILTLLEVMDLPQDVDAMAMPPSVQRERVIRPFFNALNIAAKAEYGDFSYRVIDGNGKTVTDMFSILDNYSLFRSCKIAVKLNHEPEYYAQLRQRKHDAAEAKALAKAAKVERDRATVERANKRKASSGKGKGKGKDKGREPVEPVKRGT